MIEPIFEALQAALPESFPIFLGEEHIADRNHKPPRIVLVPTNEKYGPPIAVRDENGRPAKPVLTRHITLDTHFWGKDLAQAQDMAHAFLVATHKEACPSYRTGDAYWLSKRQSGGIIVSGEVYILPITFDVPVMRTETWATLESIALEYELVSP
jgi:hypothetical protein